MPSCPQENFIKQLQSLRNKSSSLEGSSNFTILQIFYPHLVMGSDWNRRRKALKALEPTLVLDAGCGNGWFSVEASKEGFLVVAVDLSKKKIKTAKALRDVEKANNVLLLRASLTDLPFRDSVFNSVVSFEVVEHVPKVPSVFSEFNRILKHEGVLFITTVNGYGSFGVIWDIVFPKIGFARKGITIEHVHRFTECVLREILRENGFRIIRFLNSEFLTPLYVAFYEALKKFLMAEKTSILRLLYYDVEMAKHLPRRLGATWIIISRK